MEIKILGTGCAKCQQFEKTVREAIDDLGIEAEIEDIRDMEKIMEYPVLSTPGLVIDSDLVVSGRVPSKTEVSKFITRSLSRQEFE